MWHPQRKLWGTNGASDLEIKWDFLVGQYLLEPHQPIKPWVYGHEYLFTRYPLETTKFWNLVYLFTPEAWMWTFISILTIILVLYLARILSKKLGVITEPTPILFNHCFLFHGLCSWGSGGRFKFRKKITICCEILKFLSAKVLCSNMRGIGIYIFWPETEIFGHFFQVRWPLLF